MDGTSGSVVLRFGGCAFDGACGVLTDPAGNATALRPKTADLAALLLRRPRRLVTRAEILDAVWPGLFVAAEPSLLFAGTWNTYLGLIELHTQAGDHGVARLRQGLEHDAFMTRPERLAYLLVALWESGQHEAARALAADLRQRHPSVTLSWFRTRALSDHPVYHGQFSRLASSLAASGLPE